MEQILINIIDNNYKSSVISEKNAYNIAENYIIALFLLKKSQTNKDKNIISKIIIQCFKYSIHTNSKVVKSIEKVLNAYYKKFKRYIKVCDFFDKYLHTSFIQNINQKHKLMKLASMLMKKDFSKIH